MWQISYTDGHVTVHKFLEFINKRLQKNVYSYNFLSLIIFYKGRISRAIHLHSENFCFDPFILLYHLFTFQILQIFYFKH